VVRYGAQRRRRRGDGMLRGSESRGLPSVVVRTGPADLKAVSARAVSQAMQSCAGNLSEAARRLGISRNTLYRKLRQLPPG
ncbi:MAG TPA: helix-turn-helix domain-containing protein, partial [Duganella sp.]|nr:helix-turn-helix domain-containing protein [Duganella sp.]